MSNLDTGYNADGTVRTYSTIAAAVAASSDYDQVQLYYKNNTRSPLWSFNYTHSDKLLGLEGMLSNQQVTVASYTNQVLWYCSCSSAKSTNVTMQNLTFCVHAPNGNGATSLYYRNTNSGSTAKMIVKRCVSFGTSLAYFGRYGVGDVSYCFSLSGLTSYRSYQAYAQNRFCNCGAFGGGFSFVSGTVHPLLHNCFSVQSNPGRIIGTVDSNSDYNYIDDSSESVTGSNSRNDLTTDDFKFAYDVLGNLDYAYSLPGFDCRPTRDSVLINAGATYSGLTESTDIDGKAISTQPVGPSVGVDFRSEPKYGKQVVGAMRVA